MPSLLNKPLGLLNSASLLYADVQLLMSTPPRWGIYNDEPGNLTIALNPTSIISAEFKRGSRISDYPVEAGTFSSYNKVQHPADGRVTVTKSGTVKERGDFIVAVKNMSLSLTRYAVVMPEFKARFLSLVRYDNRRTATNGVTLLTVDLFFEEILTTPSKKYANTKEPSGADPSNTGTTQAAPAATAAPALQPNAAAPVTPPAATVAAPVGSTITWNDGGH